MSGRQQREMEPEEQLRLFQDRAKKLLDNPLIQNGFDASSSIEMNNMNEDPVITVTMKEPPEVFMIALLTILRQFMNNDEPIYMNKIFNTLHQCLIDDFLKGELLKARQHWKQMLEQDTIKFIRDEKELTPHFLTDMWINDAVHSYIRDAEKAEVLRTMNPLEQAVMRGKFFACVNNAVDSATLFL